MKVIKIKFHHRNTEVLPPQQVIGPKDVILAPNGQKYQLLWDEESESMQLKAEGVTHVTHNEHTAEHIILAFK